MSSSKKKRTQIAFRDQKKTSSWMCLILPRESHKHSCKQHKKGSKLLLMVQKTENLGCTKPCKINRKNYHQSTLNWFGFLPGFSGRLPLKSAAQQLKRITNHQCHRGIEVLQGMARPTRLDSQGSRSQWVTYPKLEDFC